MIHKAFANKTSLEGISTLENHTRFKVHTSRHFERIPQLANLTQEQRFAMKVVAQVLPFRVNDYVINELIDWHNVPNDPVFQLTFPQQGMLAESDFNRIADLLKTGADKSVLNAAIHDIRMDLNPHPGGQQQLNVPVLNGQRLPGLQHKYQETVLFFPSQGQTCHTYCTFCFRWAQFVGEKDLKFCAKECGQLHDYLRAHPEVSDLLITGGDPMVMKTHHLSDYLEPLTKPEFAHVDTIRIGTKSLSFWPQRFVTDADADELLDLLEKLVKSGKHVAVMAHINHWQELETPVAHKAIQRIRNTGAVIRSQAPLLNHINNHPETWTRMWQQQVKLGIIPYYMFVERDTGAQRYFEVPLVSAWQIYRNAIQKVSGLGRTARGPSMSAGPGKVEVQGVSEIAGEKVLALRFIQGRNPDWVQKPFYAKYNDKATWLNDLEPAFGQSRFFFEDEYQQMCSSQGYETHTMKRQSPVLEDQT